MTIFRAYSGFACYAAANPADNRDACTNGHQRLGIPIFYLGRARDAPYQWINGPPFDATATEEKMETAVRMNPNSTLVLGDEVNRIGGPTAAEYADIYIKWYSWLKERSRATRLSTCGFAANPSPFPFAEEFIVKVRQTIDVDEFRFNSLFNASGDLGDFDSYLGEARSFANGHGYLNKYCIGSFYSGPGLTACQLRSAMLLIQKRGTVKEAVYWGFEKFTGDVDNPLADYDNNQVPRLNDLGRSFAQTIREIGEGLQG